MFSKGPRKASLWFSGLHLPSMCGYPTSWQPVWLERDRRPEIRLREHPLDQIGVPPHQTWGSPKSFALSRTIFAASEATLRLSASIVCVCFM